MNVPRRYQRSFAIRAGRLGDVTTHQLINSSVNVGAVTAAAITMATVGGPVGAAAAGIIMAGNAIFQLLSTTFSGCGQTCVQATTVVNQLEPHLQANRDAYLSSPVHYASLQAQALANFDYTWNQVVQGCSSPALGDAGRRCISDRQTGACQYKTSPGGWSNGVYTAPGQNGSGDTCWNWFAGYRDPIANDPTVVPDPSAIGSAVGNTGALLGSMLGPGAPDVNLLLGILLLVAVIL